VEVRAERKLEERGQKREEGKNKGRPLLHSPLGQPEKIYFKAPRKQLCKHELSTGKNSSTKYFQVFRMNFKILVLKFGVFIDLF